MAISPRINQRGNGVKFFSGLRFQTGNGVKYYKGIRFQKGNGFFGRLFKKNIFPFLRYVGSKALKGITTLGEEAIKDPESFKKAAKNTAKNMGADMIDDGAKRLKKFIQTGEGTGAKKRQTKPKSVNKRACNRTSPLNNKPKPRTKESIIDISKFLNENAKKPKKK